MPLRENPNAGKSHVVCRLDLTGRRAAVTVRNVAVVARFTWIDVGVTERRVDVEPLWGCCRWCRPPTR